MVERKRYVRPTVESEEALEQTSLACNVIQEYAAPPLGFSRVCEFNVTKYGNFESLDGCDEVPLGRDTCIVQLS